MHVTVTEPAHAQLQGVIARHAWTAFLDKPTKNDEPRACLPTSFQNKSTPDYRNLSSLLGLAPKHRLPLTCEQPSVKEHLRRLDDAATLHGHKLRVVQIGANVGKDESNEWIEAMIR